MVGGGGLCPLNVLLTGIAGELYASPVLRVSGTGGRDEAGRTYVKSPGAGAYPLATSIRTFLPVDPGPSGLGEGEGGSMSRVEVC